MCFWGKKEFVTHSHLILSSHLEVKHSRAASLKLKSYTNMIACPSPTRHANAGESAATISTTV